MVVLTCDLSTCELETRGYSQLFGKSEANLSYIRPLKNKMKKKNEVSSLINKFGVEF
jgi:hypothetical protein